MNLIMRDDVQQVAEFMQSNLPANRLVEVAKALNAIAVPLWGHYDRVSAPPLELLSDRLTSLPQSTANG